MAGIGPPNYGVARNAGALVIFAGAGGTVLSEIAFESHPVGPLLDAAALLRLDHLFGHPIELFQDNRLATHARHERYHQRARRALIECRAGFRIQNTATADAAQTHVGLDHAHDPEPTQDILDPFGRVGPDRP